MRKIFIILSVLLIPFHGKAQVFTYSASFTNMAGVPGDTFNWNLTLSNPTASSVTVYLDRYQKSSPPYWRQCFCYIQCNPPSLDHLSINLAPGASSIVTLLFKTDSVNPGIATAGLKFYQSGFSNNADTMQVSATTQLATGIFGFGSFNSSVSYPNPVLDNLIFCPSFNESYILTVQNINGKIINYFFGLNDEKYAINFESYSAGQYFLKATYNSGKTETKKIIKY
jgi:hypothetical protein